MGWVQASATHGPLDLHYAVLDRIVLVVTPTTNARYPGDYDVTVFSRKDGKYVDLWQMKSREQAMKMAFDWYVTTGNAQSVVL